MNLILLDAEDFISDNVVRLRGRRLDHINNVLRAKSGDLLRVGFLGGKIGSGTVQSLTQTEGELLVALDQDPPAPLPVTVILALPRPKACRRVLQAIASMGVKHIVLLNSWRVEKSYWQSPLMTPERLRQQFLFGLEQSQDTIIPRIDLEKSFKPFAEDILPAMMQEKSGLVAHPVASRACPVNSNEPLVLAIGPEGGFTPYEIGKLATAGLEPVHLGLRTLRVETAVPAILGRLQFCA